MIYLDSAATSLLKPPEVGRAVLRAIGECASPGRGIHAPAMRAAEIVYSCREEAAALFGVPKPENVIFTLNATHGLNIAVRTVVKPGMRVMTSGYEHNAVTRPLHYIGAVIDAAEAPAFDTEALLESFRKKLPDADAVVCTHVSNVFGYILPICEIAAMCRQRGIPLIVDASQSAGALDVDFSALGAEFCAMPGHKGLMGPQGTGLLLCRDSAQPLLFGGTGSLSGSYEMPEDLPDRLEAGTHNVCGIAGLREGLRFIRRTGTARIRRKEDALTDMLAGGLAEMDGLSVLLPPKGNRAGIVSVIPKSISCEELSARLGRYGVAVRAGLHCAPQAHRTAGTDGTGTVRFSVSWFNSPREIEKALALVKKSLQKGYRM